MNIFIDESGSFVSASRSGAYNVVAAYMSPERDRRRIAECLARTKRQCGLPLGQEIKLGDLTEAQYISFLTTLGSLSGVLFAVATDAAHNTILAVTSHQRIQAAKIVEHKNRMRYEEARRGIQDLSDRVAALSPQLYVQMICQVQLIDLTLRQGILYFVQRLPQFLGAFRWRIPGGHLKFPHPWPGQNPPPVMRGTG